MDMLQMPLIFECKLFLRNIALKAQSTCITSLSVIRGNNVGDTVRQKFGIIAARVETSI